MKSKKGEGLAIGTLVVIVLAIIVLVVVALGFGMGWSNLWSKMTGYFSPVNVDSTKQACSYACTTVATHDFCILKREVKFQDKTKVEKTCKELAESYSAYGFENCPGVTCTAQVCQGTPTACNTFTTKETCEKQSGCSFKDDGSTPAVCEGTADLCEGLTVEQCGTTVEEGQLGCKTL